MIFSSPVINQKMPKLAKKLKKWPKVKVVRHFGKNNQIDKKMLSVGQNYNPHLWAKFGKDPISSFWENGGDSFLGRFWKVIVLVYMTSRRDPL